MRAIVILAAAFLASDVAYAEHGQEHEHGAGTEAAPAGLEESVLVERDQAVIQVNGVVCSFCAYGAEKSLSELDCLDSGEFGDGVLVDIDTHRITLAMRPGEKVPIRDIYERIRKAGYDPVTLHMRSMGSLERRGERLLLRDSTSSQVFLIAGGHLEGVADDADVEIQMHLDAAQVPSLADGVPVEVVIDRLISESAKEDE